MRNFDTGAEFFTAGKKNVDTLRPSVAAVSSVMMNYIHACLP